MRCGTSAYVHSKSSFSMGFRSYVREFFAAFFAPSPSFTAMVFPVRGLCFCAVFSRPRTAFWSGTQVAQKSSFSMGFRSYVRKFSPPSLRLLRPSLPWCFPVRGLCFCAVFSRPRTAFWSGTQVAQKSSFSMGFRSYVREFFAAFFALCPRVVFLRGLFSPKNRVLERGPK